MVFDGLTARGAAPLKRISAASEAIRRRLIALCGRTESAKKVAGGRAR
jgi:hypothetical protein